MVGPVETLKRPLARGSLLSGLGFIFCKPNPVLNGFHLIACPGFGRPLQQKPATARNELARSPGDERIVAIGVDSDLYAYGHRSSPSRNKLVSMAHQWWARHVSPKLITINLEKRRKYMHAKSDASHSRCHKAELCFVKCVIDRAGKRNDRWAKSLHFENPPPAHTAAGYKDA